MAKLINSFGHEYAGKQRLLNFANKLRAAGDADPLEALMPSTPGDPEQCLIANAVNFKSSVYPIDQWWPDDSSVWVMAFPRNMSLDRVEQIASKVGCKLVKDDSGKTVLRLPKDIGNTAQTFDAREGWPGDFNRNESED